MSVVQGMLVRRAVVAAARQAPVISRALAVVPCRRLPRAAALGSPHAAMAQPRVPQLCVATPLGARRLSLSAAELDKKMGEVNDLFVEARELIADALDSQGSTYFEDDLDVSFILGLLLTRAWGCCMPRSLVLHATKQFQAVCVRIRLEIQRAVARLCWCSRVCL